MEAHLQREAWSCHQPCRTDKVPCGLEASRMKGSSDCIIIHDDFVRGCTNKCEHMSSTTKSAHSQFCPS
ncbi:hypothetical protein DUNSADRAFT_3870, partial [Dunaliella salina]